MVETGSVEIPIKADASGVKSGIDDAKRGLDELGQSAETAAPKIDSVGEAADQTASKVENVGTTSETAAPKVERSSRQMEGSFKSLALGMSQTMTSGFALYSAFDDIEKKQYALDKANLTVERSTNALEKAQTAYNDAVAKYGPDSEQAMAAMESLALAQQQAELDADRVGIAQGNLNDQMTMTALTVIPAVISGIDGMAKMWGNLKNLDILTHLKGITEGLNLTRGGLIAAGAATGAIGVIFLAFTTSNKEMRLALSLLAGGLIAAAAAQWVMNAAAAFGIGLTGVGIALVAIAGAAALGVYLLSSQYGAPIESAPQAETNQYNNTSGGEGATGGGPAGGGGGASTTKTSSAYMRGGKPISQMELDANLSAGHTWVPEAESWDDSHSTRPTSSAQSDPYIDSGAEAAGYTRGQYDTWTAEGRVFSEGQWSGGGGVTYEENRNTPELIAERLADARADEQAASSIGKMNVGGTWDPKTQKWAYADGGMAVTPQIAAIAENGPEYVIPQTIMDKIGAGGGGDNYYITIYEARDADAVRREIQKGLRKAAI